MIKCHYCEREATQEVVSGEFSTIFLCESCARAFDGGFWCAKGFMQIQGPPGPPGPTMSEDIVEIGRNIDKVQTALKDLLFPILESMRVGIPVLKSAVDDAIRELEEKGLVRWNGQGWERTEDEP